MIIGIAFFVGGVALGVWLATIYLTGKEHAQTEKWNNERNVN